MSRNPADVPCTFVNNPAQLSEISDAFAGAEAVAIDTEVPIAPPRQGELRVMSIATRSLDGTERAFVVDARDLDPTLLAPVLAGVTADAWNANFDARVIDAAVWKSSDTTPDLRWWDAQIADALIHQGRSGFTWFHGLAWATDHYLGFQAEGKGTVQLSYTAFDDLTEDQISYAAADAVETLWVGDAIRAELHRSGLEQICDIELEARPFLDQMERSGLPFDWEGWQSELAQIAKRNRGVIGTLASLTGGGQGNLFDEVTEPSWNPASDRQVRRALNQWVPERVQRWTEQRHGQSRLLDETDSVNAHVLKEIGGELCETLLSFRNNAKLLSTYGESIHDHIDDDGRLRPQYLQVVGTNTGRLASRNPNAQNFTPLMKPFFRPADRDRVFVHADLSQAELRFLAQVADDAPLREAFARGVDVHVSTAASMFGFDSEQLKAEDPDQFKHLRQIAKALNFGIAYGTGAAALGRSLSSEGTATTTEEAAQLLAQYRRTYPGTAAWAEARIGEIQTIREEAHLIDWRTTMTLARGFGEVSAIRRSLRKSLGRWPTALEISVVHPDRHGPEADTLLKRIEWILGYSAPVALTEGGEPFTFASRTVAGRRQQFNLHLDRLFLTAVLEALRTNTQAMTTIRTNFEQENSLHLHRRGDPFSDAELSKQFEERALRRRYIEAVAADLGDEVANGYLLRAAKERISVMVNAWRNAPIQGGVADIMLAAYSDLDQRLRAYVDAVPVQTVHDSVVIECNRADARQVADDVREALEIASLRFCPDIVPKADVDIRESLADADVVSVNAAGSSASDREAHTR